MSFIAYCFPQPYHRAASLIAQKCPDLLNVVKEDGFSALHLASLNGHHNVVQCLVEVRKLTYWPCCVRWNGVIWLKLSIFAHLASSCANVLRKKKTFSQGRVPAPQDWFGTPICPPLYFFEHQHGGCGVMMWKCSLLTFGSRLWSPCRLLSLYNLKA